MQCDLWAWWCQLGFKLFLTEWYVMYKLQWGSGNKWEVSCWSTNGSLPCSGAVRTYSFWEGLPLALAAVVVGGKDLPLLVWRNLKSWMIKCLSLHFCTVRNLQRNLSFAKSCYLTCPGRKHTDQIVLFWQCLSLNFIKFYLAPIKGMSSSLILDASMIPYSTEHGGNCLVRRGHCSAVCI